MGTFNSSTLRLKDGREVVLRCATPDDVSALLTCVRDVMAAGVGNITTPEEFTVTEVQERAWIQEHTDSPDALVLVAVVGDRIVGNLNFRAHVRARLRHAGVLGMGVQPAWQGQGIGEALLRRLLQWARENPRIECVQLAVLADNPRAIRLYYKCGFAVNGVKPRAIRYSDGRYTDEISMHIFV